MIKINNITKSFGTFYALRGIDLQINAGEFWVIVGPNGAGKTTLLKIIATLANPSGGSIDIGDTSSLKNKLNIRKEIGFIGHQSFLYSNLSAHGIDGEREVIERIILSMNKYFKAFNLEGTLERIETELEKGI